MLEKAVAEEYLSYQVKLNQYQVDSFTIDEVLPSGSRKWPRHFPGFICFTIFHFIPFAAVNKCPDTEVIFRHVHDGVL